MNEKTYLQDSPVHCEVRDGADAAAAYRAASAAARAAEAAEDAEDLAAALAVMHEPTIPYSEVIADLRRRGRI